MTFFCLHVECTCLLGDSLLYGEQKYRKNRKNIVGGAVYYKKLGSCLFSLESVIEPYIYIYNKVEIIS